MYTGCPKRPLPLLTFELLKIFKRVLAHVKLVLRVPCFLVVGLP